MNSADAIRTAYEETDRAYRVAESKIGCIVALVLVPAGITLDFFIYPERFWHFLTLRLACDAVIAGILALHFTQLGKRYISIITFMWLMATQTMIAYMIFATEGYQSTYYAGLNLAMVAVGILLPTSFLEALIFSASTIGIYILSCTFHPDPIDVGILYNNLYFLTLTAVISITSVLFNTRRRFSEFRLSYQLDERNKQLAELDRIRSEFFANVSHELRTPLTLILAPVEDILQRRQELAPKVAEQLEVVRQNSLRLLRLVNDLLEVIRLEEGRLELERQPIRFDLLLAEVVNAMGHLAKARGVRLSLASAEQALWVRGDRGALEKVLFNLLGNALKFTGAGGNVWVRCKHSGGRLICSVRDDGIGISSKDLPHVFERFRQADSSATRRYAGTGLGLALVKDLTERHGGKVEIRSRLGEGTEVTITLPALAPEQMKLDADQAQRAAEQSVQLLSQAAEYGSVYAPVEAQPPAPDTGRATVLVVDDEEDMRRYLVELLATDYRVLQARDGASGLALARSHKPDLMLLDLMLPEIDGLEVCRMLKAAEETRSIRIVLLTARADETSKLTALKNGADDFLTKPFSSIEVQTRLANLLRGALLERDLAQRNGELRQALQELQETQGRLIQSEKINALGRLSAGLLHEINNPLNYTLTALALARQDPAVAADPDLTEILNDVEEGMQRIRAIASELRAFAYPAKSQQQPFALADAVTAALQLTTHELRDIQVTYDVSPELIVHGSQTHVSQVLVNLIANATRAIRQAQRAGEITIRARREDDKVLLSVRDNGVGITPEAQAKVFDPFYTTQDVGEGMGMGLSICQTIIQNLGGELTVQSEPSAWTEFTFGLPIATASSAAETATVASESEHAHLV